MKSLENEKKDKTLNTRIWLVQELNKARTRLEWEYSVPWELHDSIMTIGKCTKEEIAIDCVLLSIQRGQKHELILCVHCILNVSFDTKHAYYIQRNVETAAMQVLLDPSMCNEIYENFSNTPTDWKYSTFAFCRTY